MVGPYQLLRYSFRSLFTALLDHMLSSRGNACKLYPRVHPSPLLVLHMQRLAWLVIRCLTKSFLKEYVYCAMECSVLIAHAQLMTFMITLPETKPQNTKTAVAPELIRICPNQPCNPSILSPSCIIKAS